MAFVQCEIYEGPRPGFVTIGVQSVKGHQEYLAIEEQFLAKRGGKGLLPVLVIGKDQKQNMTLIQLPEEADSGARRVWVSSNQLVDEPDEVLA